MSTSAGPLAAIALADVVFRRTDAVGSGAATSRRMMLGRKRIAPREGSFLAVDFRPVLMGCSTRLAFCACLGLDDGATGRRTGAITAYICPLENGRRREGICRHATLRTQHSPSWLGQGAIIN